MARLREVPFVKGHGTGNDFVILPDLEGRLALSDDDIRWLCDRRRGLGADGVLRVVKASAMPGFGAQAEYADYFMDYRNGDGSVAEMCGNGARVFVRYLDAVGLITDNETSIGTRAGVLPVVIGRDETGEVQITIAMGQASPLDGSLRVSASDHTWQAVGVHLPNPHAIVFVESLEQAGDLHRAPEVSPAALFPDGANIEFVIGEGERHVAMRVHERGVGETLSCGTGACAVAWAARRHFESGVSGTTTWRVDVPGGSLTVTESETGDFSLTGPATLVARGTVLLP